MKLLEQLSVVARRRGLAAQYHRCLFPLGQTVSKLLCGSAWRMETSQRTGNRDVEAFLTDLVVRRHVAGATQNQALNALVFLYQQVLEDTIPQDHLGKFVLQRSSRPKRVPTVLCVEEVRRVIEAVPQEHMSRLLVELLYGTGCASARRVHCGSGILT